MTITKTKRGMKITVIGFHLCVLAQAHFEVWRQQQGASMTTNEQLPVLQAPAAEDEPSPIPVLWRRWGGPSERSSEPSKSTVGSVAVAFALLALCALGLFGFIQVLAGQTKLHGAVLIATPFVAFLFAGCGVTSCLHVYAHFARREDEDELQTRFWHWWSDTIGGGIVKLAIGATLVVLGYVVLHALFAPLATSTGLIIALLFGILLVLCQIASRLVR